MKNSLKRIEELEKLILKSIEKISKNKKIGLLFSGGIDSLALAFYLKKLNYNFTCYTSPFNQNSEDLIYSKEITKLFNLKSKYTQIELEKIPKYLKKVVPIIKNTSPVNVSIALTLFTAAELAKKDKVDLILTGSGPDELFGGYARHKNSKDLNNELREGLKSLYQNDIPRDQSIINSFGLELISPFLDKEIIEFAMNLPEDYKINGNTNKFILRQLLFKNKLPEKFSLRKKTAAQYGSKFDKAIEKLAKNKSKTEYLNQFYNLGVLFSSGKDSTYAAYILKKQRYNLSCLITIKSQNKDSFMFHTPNIDIVDLQSKAMDIPLIKQNTRGEKEEELKDLEKALIKAKKKYNILGVTTGALFSEYQSERINKICKKLELKVFSPLWHKDQSEYMKELLYNGFEFIISSIAADGLNKNWLGKQITKKEIDELIKINKINNLNVAGEGGEFESLVLDSPLFNKKIKIIESKIKMENNYTGRFYIKKAKLVSK